MTVILYYIHSSIAYNTYVYYHYNITTRLLQYYYILLQYYYILLQYYYILLHITTILLQYYYILLQYYYILLQYYYILLQYYYNITTILLQYYYNIITILLHITCCMYVHVHVTFIFPSHCGCQHVCCIFSTATC